MVRNGHRQDLSPGDWLQSQCSQPTQNFQDVFCGGGGGSGEGMGGEMQSNIYGQVRFILKKNNTSLYLYAQTTYRRVYEKLFLFGFYNIYIHYTFRNKVHDKENAGGGGRKR